MQTKAHYKMLIIAKAYQREGEPERQRKNFQRSFALIAPVFASLPQPNPFHYPSTIVS